MRLSYQIPIITGLAIIATTVVNILAFQYFMSTLFVEYTREVQENDQKSNLSPDKLRAVLDVSNLSSDKQEEYKTVVSELSTISTSLENISNNPELYIQDGSWSREASESSYAISAVRQSSTPERLFANITTIITNPTSWARDTPESRLIIALLVRLLATNLVFLSLVIGIYFWWIRRVFAPVHLIIDRLQAYIDSSRYQRIVYTRDDEFAPLVQTINSLYKSLRVQENIRSNFLSDISHEIRTPITAVKCYLEAIEDGMMQLDTKTVPLLQAELTRLTSITEEIMQYEHLTHHVTTDIHVERFSIRPQIEELIYEYTPQLLTNQQTILITGDIADSMRMDTNMFVQVLHNIFSNFIKYAGKWTTLTCQYSLSKESITIEFSDTGVGIPEEEISLVREKFYRVDKARTRDSSMSMGIGLSIIDHIIRIHDGSLDISNNIPHGLTIVMTIPR